MHADLSLLTSWSHDYDKVEGKRSWLETLSINLTDGDILQVHVDAGVAGLYPDVVAAPLSGGEDILIPPEVVSPHRGWLSVSGALAVRWSEWRPLIGPDLFRYCALIG